MDTQTSGGAARRIARAAILGLLGVVLLGVAGIRGGSAPVAPASAVDTVVAARALPAGQTLANDDLRVVDTPASSLDGAEIHRVEDARGRRLLIAMPAGAPILAVMLTSQPPPIGRRMIRLSVDSAHVAPDIQTGADVEVLAASDASSNVGQPAGRIVDVGTCVVTDTSSTAAQGSSRALVDRPSPAPSRISDSAVSVGLDCEVAVARDVIWAEIYARALRILARSPGDPAPPAHGGLTGGP